MAKIQLALVDDHQIVLDGIKSLLHNHPLFEVAIECNNPLEICERLKKTPVQILLTDVSMPEMNGDQLAREVRQRFPQIKILVLSMNGEGHLVNKMIEESDISGYVLKNISRQELVAALEKIYSGGVYFSDVVLKEMLASSEQASAESEPMLTLREVEIVKLIEKELTNKQIADYLFISERTVETHRKNIFRKTKTTGLIGLVKYAYQHGIV